MEARYDILPEDVRAALAHIRKHPTRSNRLGRILLLLCILLHIAVVPFVFWLFPDPALDASPICVWIIIGQIAVWAVFFVVAVKASARPAIRKGHDKDITLTIGPEWFRYGNASLFEFWYRWHDIEKIGVTDDHAFFFIGPQTVCVLPRRAFADREAYQKFVETARRYLDGAKAFVDNPYEDVK